MKYIRPVLFVLVVLLIVSCTQNAEPTETSTLPSPTDTEPSPTDTEPSPTDTEPPPTVDPYSQVVHTDVPEDTVFWDIQTATECNTGRSTPLDSPPVIGQGCNQWEINYLEIPTDLLGETYIPKLDIIRIQMGQDDSWFYARLTMYSYESEVPVLDGGYGFEFDMDFDGRGDVFIFVEDPSQFGEGEWHVMGVQAWMDENINVGGDTPVYADEDNPGDGYEIMVFDQGLGEDPDLVWARLSPEVAGAVEFAMKLSLLDDEDGVFVWWGWANQEPFDPRMFDYVDTYSDGDVAYLDNSCRWIFGAPPQDIPNICPYTKAEPEKPSGGGNGAKGCWVTPPTGGQTCIAPCPNPCPQNYACTGSCNP